MNFGLFGTFLLEHTTWANTINWGVMAAKTLVVFVVVCFTHILLLQELISNKKNTVATTANPQNKSPVWGVLPARQGRAQWHAPHEHLWSLHNDGSRWRQSGQWHRGSARAAPAVGKPPLPCPGQWESRSVDGRRQSDQSRTAAAAVRAAGPKAWCDQDAPQTATKHQSSFIIHHHHHWSSTLLCCIGSLVFFVLKLIKTPKDVSDQIFVTLCRHFMQCFFIKRWHMKNQINVTDRCYYWENEHLYGQTLPHVPQKTTNYSHIKMHHNQHRPRRGDGENLAWKGSPTSAGIEWIFVQLWTWAAVMQCPVSL